MITLAERQRGQSSIPPLCNGDRLSMEEFIRRSDLHPEIKKAELIDGEVYIADGCSATHESGSGPAGEWTPPLYNGDELSLEEFERRWSFHPEIKKAELIDGVVYLEMTVSDFHAAANALVNLWLGVYWSTRTHLVRVYDIATMRLADGQNVQPDSMLRYLAGTSTIERSIVVGPPELVVEIASSSFGRDLGPKKDRYRDAGVAEYVVWQEFENRLDWFVIEDGEYRALAPDDAGIIESRVFPGLRLPVQALLEFDAQTVVAAIAPLAK